jgi:hypothetical protein
MNQISVDSGIPRRFTSLGYRSSLEFTNPRSSVILQLDEETNCLLTSSNKPIEAEALKQ